MKEILFSEDVVPIGEFKARAAKWLAQLNETDHPLVITQNGRPAAILLSPQEYDRFQEKERFLYSISKGLEDVKEGRVFSTKEIRKKFTR
jgi:prevent-host-death family protein